MEATRTHKDTRQAKGIGFGEVRPSAGVTMVWKCNVKLRSKNSTVHNTVHETPLEPNYPSRALTIGEEKSDRFRATWARSVCVAPTIDGNTDADLRRSDGRSFTNFRLSCETVFVRPI